MICCNSICRVWIALTGSSPARLFTLWMDSFPPITTAMSSSSMYSTLLVCSMMALWVQKRLIHVIKYQICYSLVWCLQRELWVALMICILDSPQNTDTVYLTWRQRQSNTPQPFHPPQSYGCSSPGLHPWSELQGQRSEVRGQKSRSDFERLKQSRCAHHLNSFLSRCSQVTAV